MPRLVRRQSLLTRVQSYPLDLGLRIVEHINSVDWASRQKEAVYGGMCMMLLLALLKLYFDHNDLSTSPDLLFLDGSTEGPARSGILRIALSSVYYAIHASAILNAGICFCATKTYTLMGRPAEKKPETSSARLVSCDSTGARQTGLRPWWYGQINELWSGSSAWPLEPDSQYWQLDVWDPPLFNLYLLSTFSPLHTFFLVLSPLNVYLVLYIAGLSASCYWLISSFIVQAKDKALLHGEVLGEYGKKVVQPVYCTATKDKAIGADGSVDSYASCAQSAFVTRSVRPSPLKMKTLDSVDPPSPWHISQRVARNRINLASRYQQFSPTPQSHRLY